MSEPFSALAARLSANAARRSRIAWSLAAFLAESAKVPFQWGERDCCLWLGDWIVFLGLPDPVAEFRGRYRTPLGAFRLLKKHGGVEGLVARQAERAGLERTENPKAGDVGVVRYGVEVGGAICTGPRWALLSDKGVSSVKAEPLAVWSV